MASTTGQDNMADAQELLGKAGSGLPVWLNPEKFLTDEFEPEGCISDLRRYVPLATLQVELQSYLSLLRNKLVEVINEDYSDYVSLSSKLGTVDGAVLRMRKPLVELKDKLNVVQEAVKGEVAALNQGLKRRKEIATARGLLELLQEIAHVASKVEKLLAEVAATPEADLTSPALLSDGSASSSQAADLDAQSRLLERVASEVSRLSFLAARGKDLAYVRNIEPRIGSSRALLEARLERVLAAALVGKLHGACLHCLHAYVELGDPAPAEGALRAVLVAPAVEGAVAQHKAAHPRVGGPRDDGLDALFTSLLVSVRGALGPLLDACLAPASGLRILDVLGGVMLAEVLRVVTEQMPGVFSPGVPPAFHANYLAYARFLDALEGLARSSSAIDRLRGSAAYAGFARRWNTNVYFSLMYQDIAGELEDALGQASLEPHPPSSSSPAGGAKVRLACSGALVNCLTRCTSSEVFLTPLADRFLRLALQLITRYTNWVSALTQARRSGGSGPPPYASPAGTPSPGPPMSSSSPLGPSASQQLDAASSGRGGESPVPLPASASASAVASLAANASPEELSCVQAECESICWHVQTVFLPAFTTYLRGIAGLDTETAVSTIVHEATAELEGAGDALLAWVAEEIAERCCGVVKQLKGITATYRVTSKGPPTRHSHYVAGVLLPLREFLEHERVESCLGARARHAAAVAVVSAVSVRYQQLAEDLLTGVRKTESSLKRLKKTRAGEGEAAGDSSGMSDSEKVTLQLHLDVEEFGRQLLSFGITPDSLPSFARLADTVAPSNARPAEQL